MILGRVTIPLFMNDADGFPSFNQDRHFVRIGSIGRCTGVLFSLFYKQWFLPPGDGYSVVFVGWVGGDVSDYTFSNSVFTGGPRSYSFQGQGQGVIWLRVNMLLYRILGLRGDIRDWSSS